MMMMMMTTRMMGMMGMTMRPDDVSQCVLMRKPRSTETVCVYCDEIAPRMAVESAPEHDGVEKHAHTHKHFDGPQVVEPANLPPGHRVAAPHTAHPEQQSEKHHTAVAAQHAPTEPLQGSVAVLQGPALATSQLPHPERSPQPSFWAGRAVVIESVQAVAQNLATQALHASSTPDMNVDEVTRLLDALDKATSLLGRILTLG
jgi:hypothetical protein